MTAPRVFVTGIGMVTALGLTTSSSWNALISSSCAVRKINILDCLPVQIAASVAANDLPPLPSYFQNTPPFISYAMAAAQEALQDAQLIETAADPKLRPNVLYSPEIAGVSMGVGMAHIPDIVTAATHLSKSSYRKVTPFLVPRILPNTPAGVIALQYSAKGPILTPATACAAGAHALGDALHAIRRGDVDLMIAGGSEAAIHPVAVAGFARAKALTSSFNDNPEKASRPFDSARNGFVLGDGACVMVLESEEHVQKRNARVYAELCGFGMSGDAYHITSPCPNGSGAIRAMQAAIRSSDADANDVDYVNAHATSTPIGDAIERMAIAQVLRDNTRAVVSSTKGATGHLLGAAGAVEAAFSALSVAHDVVPPTLNLESIDEDEETQRLGWGARARYVPKVARNMTVKVALSNSFGFGGTNACVAFRKAPGEFGLKDIGVSC